MMISRGLWSASQKRSTQCNSPDLLSLTLLPRSCLSSTLSSRWQRWKERQNKRQASFESHLGGCGGVVCVMISHLKRKKNISQAACFCEGFIPGSVCFVSSECHAFDMRVSHGPAGKRSVCVFMALHTLRWGGAYSHILTSSWLWRARARHWIEVCLFYV